jgi:hypothetical protein
MFIDPLYGHTTTFLVDSRRANLALARLIASRLSVRGASWTVLDLDALYSSGSDAVFATADESGGAEIIVPDPGSPAEVEVAGLTGSAPERVLVIDSLNSLYHLFSSGGLGSRNMKLAFAVALLSYIARTEKRAVFLTMYRRERAMRFGRQKSISDLSDLTVSVNIQGASLVLRCERGSAWPGGELTLSIP